MMTEGVVLLPVERHRRTFTTVVVGAMTPLAFVLSDPQNVCDLIEFVYFCMMFCFIYCLVFK